MSDSLQDLPLWNEQDARKVLNELCGNHRIPQDVLEELVGIVRDRLHQERRHGINDAFAEILGRMED